MKILTSIMLLTFAVAANGELEYSTNINDFQYLEDKNLLFYYERNGKDYIKTFTCGDDFRIFEDRVNLACESGFGEEWIVYFYIDADVNDFGLYYFFQINNAGLVPYGSFAYSIEHDGGIRTASYLEVLEEGFGLARPAYVRNISIKDPKYSPSGYFEGYDPDPTLISMEPPYYQITFDAFFGEFNIENILIGKNNFTVTIEQSQTSPDQFILTNYSKK